MLSYLYSYRWKTQCRGFWPKRKCPSLRRWNCRVSWAKPNQSRVNWNEARMRWVSSYNSQKYIFNTFCHQFFSVIMLWITVQKCSQLHWCLCFTQMERRYQNQLQSMKERLEQSDCTNRSLQNYVHFLKTSYGNVFGDSLLTSWQWFFFFLPKLENFDLELKYLLLILTKILLCTV